LTPELLDFLVSYSWPGNVREMQNLVERMVILAEGDRLTLSDLTPDVVAAVDIQPQEPKRWPQEFPVVEKKERRKSLYDIERAEIESALNRHGWVQVRAARELGLTQRQIGYRIRKYKITPQYGIE
jgi:Nif-specific regulatory protein